MKLKYITFMALVITLIIGLISFYRVTSTSGQSLARDKELITNGKVLTGQAALSGDWSTDAPGRSKIN